MNRRSFLGKLGKGALASQVAIVNPESYTQIMNVIASPNRLINYWLSNIDILDEVYAVMGLMNSSKTKFTNSELDLLTTFEDQYNIEDFFAVQNEMHKMNFTARSFQKYLEDVFECGSNYPCRFGYQLKDHVASLCDNKSVEKLYEMANTPIDSPLFAELRSVAGPMWKSRIEFLNRMKLNSQNINSSLIESHLHNLNYNMASMKKFLGGPVPHSQIVPAYNKSSSCERYLM